MFYDEPELLELFLELLVLFPEFMNFFWLAASNLILEIYVLLHGVLSEFETSSTKIFVLRTLSQMVLLTTFL